MEHLQGTDSSVSDAPDAQRPEQSPDTAGNAQPPDSVVPGESADSGTTAPVKRTAEETAERLDELFDTVYRVAKTTIREHPIFAVAVAGAVGLVVAAAIRRAVR